MTRAVQVSLPRWIDNGLIPLINLFIAFGISSLLVLAIGQDPIQTLWVLIKGSFGADQIGYTLYYTTNFIFTGLAVAIAFHCGLLNIGGEGQLYVAGLGVALVCIPLGGVPWFYVLPLAILATALFGGIWAGIPGWLQAKRGSHIVITTIMFNFIASAFMTYMIVKVLSPEGSQAPESVSFDASTHLPYLHDFLASFGITIAESPMNISLIWALFCAVFIWAFVWHSRWGYMVRTVGENESAAVYAGISPSRIIIMTMFISGALAGFAALNIIMGEQHRLVLHFSGGFGFVGIAVAFMGRQHPVGIVLASLLFGALYQGGSELAFEIPGVDKDFVVVIQGLIILFTGALEYWLKPKIRYIYAMVKQ